MKSFTLSQTVVALGLCLAILGATRAENIQSETPKIHTGTIRVIQPDARLVTVEGGPTYTFTVPSEAEIVTKDKAHADLADLKVGDIVEVRYTREAAGYTAQKIAIRGLK